MMVVEEPILMELKRLSDPDGQERVGAVASMVDALTLPDLEEKARIVEQEYRDLIARCAKNLEIIKRSKGDAKPRWQIGNDILDFQNLTAGKGAQVCNVIEALSRDLGISRSQLSYIVRFREMYSVERDLSPHINWSKYRELLDFSNEESRKICEKLIVSGKIKTDSEIREFKKNPRVHGIVPKTSEHSSRENQSLVLSPSGVASPNQRIFHLPLPHSSRRYQRGENSNKSELWRLQKNPKNKRGDKNGKGKKKR
jgi:hypothetical protein